MIERRQRAEHFVVGSGKSSIHNSVRTVMALRTLGLSVFADAFSVLLPLNVELVKKALSDLDDIEVTFFLRETFREEHKIFFDEQSLVSLEDDIVDAFCRRFEGERVDVPSGTRSITKTLEALPVHLRQRVRSRMRGSA
jgi:hypothetical protein